MNSTLFQIAFVLVLSAIQIPETSGEKNKIKIIVPHKINYVHHHHHHHHPKQLDEKPNKKHRFVPHALTHHHVHHDEEEEGSEEEVHESPHFGSYELDHEEESDGSHRGIAYYAIPASKLTSAAANLIMQPVFLYNDSFHKIKRHHPSTYAFLRFGDYPHRGRHHPNHGPLPPPPPPPPPIPPTDPDFDFK